jgi:hypothetical protein
MSWQQFIRTNDEGERVIDYDLLDIGARINFNEAVDRWVASIELDFECDEFTNAEKVEAIDHTVSVNVSNSTILDKDGNEVEYSPDTAHMIRERMAQKLAERYGVKL